MVEAIGSLRIRMESWIRDQTEKMKVTWPLPPSPPKLRWPPWKKDFDRKEHERKLREEFERQRKKLDDLCAAVKAESVSDLQDVLCSMVLSECVYKKPATEMIRVINKFKADFGGQVVSLKHVQPSLDHVPHRYLLAEAGDTLFASFIGTKQYKDVIADANIFQGVIFHEDTAEDINPNGVPDSDNAEGETNIEEKLEKPLQSRPNHVKKKSNPAAHRGFLARAKGIPALELYKLAQKRKQKLVLCGHSLGGAVAALATLAILRVFASSSPSKELEKVQLKCITFSQPPVGNAALRDYVHQKGWQSYFKTYCIPEDLVPRILSPAYFHHYNAQPLQASDDMRLNGSPSVKRKEETNGLRTTKPKENEGQQLVIGLGPIQTSFWRLFRLVPLDGVRKQLDRLKGGRKEPEALVADSGLISKIAEIDDTPQSLEIQEGSDVISLAPRPGKERTSPNGSKTGREGNNGSGVGDSGRWRRVPYLPQYVPFGKLYLLGNSSVEFLSDAEYSKLTSVTSVISELRERLQSHSMKSYRSRFQKIYEQCMCSNASPFLGVDQLPQFPHLQQWLGLAAAGTVELGHIVEAPVIQTATSIVPLGWSGVPGEKNSDPLKVDITGYGLHLCNLVQAQVNGNWCSTVVESLPSAIPYCLDHDFQPDLQKMRVLIGAPLRRPPRHPVPEDSLVHMVTSLSADCADSSQINDKLCSSEDGSLYSESLKGFVIHCISDFVTVSKEVYVRTRRVRLLGLEVAGKTSLITAILDHSRQKNGISLESIHIPVGNHQEGMAGGVCYSDSTGINLQDLHLEATRFREELQMGVSDLRRKIDLIVFVHNLAHKVPQYNPSDTSQPSPALTLLLDEAKALGIPWVLALTNKYSVSAHQKNMLVNSVMEAYQASPSMTEVVNSSPYVLPTAPQIRNSADEGALRRRAQRIILAPVNIVQMPFQRNSSVMPVDGVNSLIKLVHRVLRSHEEASFQELVKERLSLELARKQPAAMEAIHNAQEKGSSMTAAAVGASLGAGLGLVLAVVMGAASALRKP